MPDAAMRRYLPNHEVTPTYFSGLQAVESNDLPKALTILSAEPVTSSCRGLALANKALIELRLDRFRAAERTAETTLEHFELLGCPHPPTWVQTLRNLGEAVRAQGRVLESLSIFNAAGHTADKLVIEFPAFTKECLLEKAHAFNSWGGSLIIIGRIEAAVDCLTAARDIYRKYPENIVGLAESLTNLARAYTVLGRRTDAAFSIEEAKQFATGDEEQIHRIHIVGAQLGLHSKSDARRVLLDAASAAERSGFIETAHLRHCIAASLADEHKDHAWGMEVVSLAVEMEHRLAPTSLQPPRLSFYKAAFLEQSGHASSEVLDALLDGARLWCDRLPGPLSMSDYQQAVGLMHDHFRKLSGILLRDGRNREAFVAFESGRARAFAVEVNGDYQHPLLATNPFRESEVDCSLLNRIQEGLTEDHLVISLAVLPPNLVAFIVGRNLLEVCAVPLASDAASADAFGAAVHAISSGLRDGKGVDCIPDQIKCFGREVASKLGKRSIALLAPHALLHKVPWRTLLRHEGTPWSQLPFITQFSPLFDPDSPTPDVVLPIGAVALSHGSAGSGSERLSFEDEAAEFAHAFGSDGRLVPGARAIDVARALQEAKTVLLSCHGDIVSTVHGDRFLLDLIDGGHTPTELFEDRVIAPLVILSACSSGVYEMAWGDYPIGAAPTFLLAGARFCVCTRFPISAHFAKMFFPTLGRLLNGGQSVGNAFAGALLEMELQGYDAWRHLACVELLGCGMSSSK